MPNEEYSKLASALTEWMDVTEPRIARLEEAQMNTTRAVNRLDVQRQDLEYENKQLKERLSKHGHTSLSSPK